MPKSSVIIPCFNSEKNLSKSIESVLSQTDIDFELLIVIDGLTDDSKKVAEGYAERDQRIKVFEKVHGGLSDTRNYGLSKATGEYIYFMDSDDWIDANLLKDNLRIMEEEQLDFIEFGYTREDENKSGKHISSLEIIPSDERWEKGEGNIVMDVEHLDLMGYAWNKIYKKSFLDFHRLKFEKGLYLIEDVLFNCEVLLLSQFVRFNPQSYYHYANRPSGSILKIFHPDSFEINKRKIEVLQKVFRSWKVKNENEIMNITTFISIRYCVLNLLTCKNDLSFFKKVKFLKKIYNDDLTRKYVPGHKPPDVNRRILKFLIQYRMPVFTCLMRRMIT